jgi:hypothetical protein
MEISRIDHEEEYSRKETYYIKQANCIDKFLDTYFHIKYVIEESTGREGEKESVSS